MLKERLRPHGSLLVGCLILTVLLALYRCFNTGVFTLDELNVDATSALPILLVAAGQTIVLLRGGIDLSVGGIISLGTVLAATSFGESYRSGVLTIVGIMTLGTTVGAVNGVLISGLKLQAFLVTLSTWSMTAGAALIVLPTDGGSLPRWWTSLANLSVAGIQAPFWAIVFVGAFWAWFSRTRILMAIRGAGSNAKAAFLTGVGMRSTDVITYAISGLFAALASLVLSIQMASGSPTVGNSYILTSVAASVIGGVNIFGGRGSFWCTMVGAAILVIIANLVFALQVSSYWQPALAGAILLLSVMAGSLAEALAAGEAG